MIFLLHSVVSSLLSQLRINPYAPSLRGVLPCREVKIYILNRPTKKEVEK
jgi:hypothetical protein